MSTTQTLSSALPSRVPATHNGPIARLADFFTQPARTSTIKSGSLRTGRAIVDDLTGGFPKHAVTEIFTSHAGLGEIRLLLPALAHMDRVVWVLSGTDDFEPYAPALKAAGLDPARQLFVQPTSPEEAFWCAEQAAASGEVSAVVAKLNPLAHGRDAGAVSKLAMAARTGHTTLFLLRPSSMICTPTSAELRIQLMPASSTQAGTHVRASRRGTFFDRVREADVHFDEERMPLTIPDASTSSLRPKASRRRTTDNRQLSLWESPINPLDAELFSHA